MEFIIEKVKPENGKVVEDVILQVQAQMEHPEWYLVDEPGVVRKVLRSGNAIAYRAVEAESNVTAGAFLAIVPENLDENLGKDIGLPIEACSRVVHMDSAAVLSAYRGNGLQSKMAVALEKELYREGYRYLMCTVHPDNRYSRESMERLGYRVMKTAEKYGGLLRNILLKEV